MVVEDHRVRTLRTSVAGILAAGQSGARSGERTYWAQRELIQVLDELEADAEPARVGRSSATRVAQQSIEVADTVGPMPTMTDLASASGLSDRWIRAAFHKVYGISPSAFFRARAMSGAHRQLRSAPPESVTVTEVAMSWGFWHLGRFSAAYRSYFGELPSETLVRID
jgi:AraC-like DNA-binding protein